MAGERILVAEESGFVQEVCRALLEEHGHIVVTASNGLAAVNYPEVADIDLLIVDEDMPGWDGFTTTKTVRQTAETASMPVLLLIEEDKSTDRENLNLRGANGFLMKPFRPTELLHKVTVLLEERQVTAQARQRLAEVADQKITELAEAQVQLVVEKKSQIIVERMIQQVIEVIDDKARREIDRKVTSLGEEKEQELIRSTVAEVSRAAVDKQAEEKVVAAIEEQLGERIEKAVRRAAEGIVPAIARDRLKDSMQSVLTREVQVRVQQAAESLVPDVSHKLISTVDTLVQKVVPKVTRDLLPDLADRHISLLCSKTIPHQIENQVRTQVSHQMRQEIHPQINRATRDLWLRVLLANIALFGISISLIIWCFYKAGIPFPWE